MTLTLLDAADPPSWTNFFAVPRQVYRGDPHWVAPLRGAERESLERADFRSRQRAWVALDADRPVARLVARVSPVLRGEDGRPYGLLGFFEALEHGPAVRELFRAAVAWLRERGAGPIVGPMDGDTWHRYRLNVGPWDEPPFLMEPYNPAYYPGLWEENGFGVLEEYLSQQLDDPAAVLARLEPRYREALEAGYRLETLRLDRFDDELRRFYRLSCVIFRGNFLYSEISEEDFLALYAGTRRLVDPDFVVFAIAPDGRDAGFLFAYPDHFRAVAALRGGRGPLALLRFLLARRRGVDTLDMKSLGLLPEHRRAHLGSALMAHGYRTALEKGYRKLNHCLIKDDNPSGRFEAGLGRLLRRYRLYQLREDAP